MSQDTLLYLIGSLGIGAVLGAYVQAWFERRNKVSADEHTLKRARYGSVLIQMLTVLAPESGLPKIEKIRPDLRTLDDVQQELKNELLNAVLFANDDVIRCLSKFIRTPSHDLYLSTAAAMRKDLWGKTTRITEKDLGALT